jgi:hypothetical protein
MSAVDQWKRFLQAALGREMSSSVRWNFLRSFGNRRPFSLGYEIKRILAQSVRTFPNSCTQLTHRESRDEFAMCNPRLWRGGDEKDILEIVCARRDSAGNIQISF